MCQDKVLDYILKHPRERIDIVTLVNNLKINRPNISRACRVLREHKEIKFQAVRLGKVGAKQKFLYYV